MEKTVIAAILSAAALCACAADGEDSVSFDAGADLRVRQEIIHNIPGLPGAPDAMMPRESKKDVNHIRFRPRVWGLMNFGDFGIYGRLADEFREHIVKNGVRRKDRNYNFPDEVIVDSLYFEGRGIFDGFLDFRLGRQDMFERGHSVFGLDRTLFDGSPYVGSRSCYSDMAKFTFHVSEESKLDAFAMYNNGRNALQWGTPHSSKNRPMNAIRPGDSPEMDEWGGGAVWHDSLFEKRLPYKIYAIHKRNTSYTAAGGRRMPSKQLTTFGANLQPELNEYVSFEFEGAKQFGSLSDGSKQAGGWMAYAAAELHRARDAQGVHPYARASVYCLSGDKHRGGAGDNDTAWDPLWGRWPQDSELMQYGTLYGLGFWSNMIYPKLSLGANFGPHHGLCAYSGPMFAAVQDHAGHADGGGDGMFKGVFSVIRYDFPILLKPKDAKGLDRFEIFGHVMAELLNPGDYYDSSRPAWFLRWEMNFVF